MGNFLIKPVLKKNELNIVPRNQTDRNSFIFFREVPIISFNQTFTKQNTTFCLQLYLNLKIFHKFMSSKDLIGSILREKEDFFYAFQKSRIWV